MSSAVAEGDRLACRSARLNSSPEGPMIGLMYAATSSVVARSSNWADGTMENNGLVLANNSSLSTGLKASEYNDGQRSYLEITYEPCSVDKDGDGDVDGSDLAAAVSGFDGACIKALANNFGAY